MKLAMGGWVFLALNLVGCGGDLEVPSVRDGRTLTTLRMDVDPPGEPGSESYQCSRIDAGGARGEPVHALRWTPPSGALTLHHAMLFVTDEEGPEGPTPCDPMPKPVAVLPLYAPGGDDQRFPEGISIVIPSSTTAFFVELHLLRVSGGSATASVDVEASADEPDHLAAWVDDPASVPAIEPNTSSTSRATCKFDRIVHVVASWPHMHALGKTFQSTVVRNAGERETLLDIPWDFSHQTLHAVSASLLAGDAIETACTWANTTGALVAAGPRSVDEMCNQGLVVWPHEFAYCVP